MKKITKIIIIAFIIIALSSVGFGLYYMYFQFNSQDVKDYINEECEKYPEDVRPGVYKIIKDGVDHILSERNLAKQVIEFSKQNKTPREQELVHASIMMARSYGYIA